MSDGCSKFFCHFLRKKGIDGEERRRGRRVCGG
jgi:hypothetical protein